MTGAQAIRFYQDEHADEMEARAELMLKKAIELQYEAMELLERAAILRAVLSYGPSQKEREE